MKIQQINNNNIAHKAYFKNDAAGYFKKYWNSSIGVTAKMEALASDLRNKCPNHALEISKVEEGYQESKSFEIFNTTTGQKLRVYVTKSENFIERILSTIIEKAEGNNIFFNENSKYANFFKTITGQ